MCIIQLQLRSWGWFSIHSALTFCAQVQNKKAIVECIIIYDALHKRTIYLDAFCAGLEVMGIKTMISLFPELCKPAFVADGAITSQRVTDMLKPHLPDKREDMNDDERRVWQYLVDFVSQANEEGRKFHV